jgi:hypothetical protein
MATFGLHWPLVFKILNFLYQRIMHVVVIFIYSNGVLTVIPSLSLKASISKVVLSQIFFEL